MKREIQYTIDYYTVTKWTLLNFYGTIINFLILCYSEEFTDCVRTWIITSVTSYIHFNVPDSLFLICFPSLSLLLLCPRVNVEWNRKPLFLGVGSAVGERSWTVIFDWGKECFITNLLVDCKIDFSNNLSPFWQGFTAGGFIYIAIAGVLAEMNNGGNTTLRSTVVQIISLTIGMAVALGISLVEWMEIGLYRTCMSWFLICQLFHKKYSNQFTNVLFIFLLYAKRWTQKSL